MTLAQFVWALWNQSYCQGEMQSTTT